MIAALYVRADGPYVGRADVDPWPMPSETALFSFMLRDARKYDGPHAGVFHPPCARYSRLAHIHKHRPGMGIGEDGGCFAAALAGVERWGGVLEHPAGSEAWPMFKIGRPTSTGWTPTRKGWTCSVDQGVYGHVARKRTWLYYVNPRDPLAMPPDLDWSEAPVGERSAIAGCVGVERQAKSQRELTPPAFAEVLIALARGAA